MYDIITVGSAGVDVFLKSKSKDIEIEHIHAHDDVCLPIGSKILVSELYTSTGGGGMNSAIAFRRMGFKTGYIGKIGKDLNGEEILRTLKKEKVAFLGKQAEGNSGYSTILTGLQKNRTILTHKGINNELKERDIKWAKSKWVFICTMMGESLKTAYKIAKKAKKQKSKICINPSLYLARQQTKLKPLLDTADVIIFNKEEAQALTKSKAGINTMLKKIQKQVPLVVITDGPQGAYAYDGTRYKITPKKVRIVETTGTGDAFASGFIAGLMKKKNIETCLKYGAANAHGVLSAKGATNVLLNYSKLVKSSRRCYQTLKQY